MSLRALEVRPEGGSQQPSIREVSAHTVTCFCSRQDLDPYLLKHHDKLLYKSPDRTAGLDVAGEPLISEGPPAKLLSVQANNIDEKGTLDVDGPLAHLHVTLMQEAAALQLLHQLLPLGALRECGTCLISRN